MPHRDDLQGQLREGYTYYHQNRDSFLNTLKKITNYCYIEQEHAKHNNYWKGRVYTIRLDPHELSNLEVLMKCGHIVFLLRDLDTLEPRDPNPDETPPTV